MKGNANNRAKVSFSVSIDKEILDILERRAKREFMSVDELVSDILRRSVVSYRGPKGVIYDKVDDKFLTYFSRKNRKRKK